MKLIAELSEAVRSTTQIDEATGKKNFFIEGIFAVAEQKNQNGRIYPLDTLREACNKFQTVIGNNRALGELSHPAGPAINLDKVSHIIKEMKYTGDGHTFSGRAQVLDTPNGIIVQKLLEGGASLGVSTRGMGSLVMKEGYHEVQPDYHLATVDVVADPSAPGAFINGVMEGREWIWESGIYREVDLSNAKKRIDEGARRKRSEETALRIFEQFLGKL